MAETRIVCSCCGEPKKLTDYYGSSSPINRFHGKLSICKDCLADLVDMDDVRSLMDAMRMVDRPFLMAEYEGALEKDKNRFGEYMRRLGMRQNRALTWDDSEFNHNYVEEKQKEEMGITDELVEKYGAGYTNEEYRAFERKYKKLIKNYTEQTAMHSEGLISYIRFRVKEEMATARGDSKEAKEWGALAQKAAQDAKLNVSQLSKSDISGGVDLMTQLSEAVESELSVIPLLPKVLAQPYDDVDLVLWSNINYNRRLEDKPVVPYRDVWSFYDEMINEYCNQKGMSDSEKEEFINKRKGVFRDLSELYKEPLYEDDDI